MDISEVPEGYSVISYTSRLALIAISKRLIETDRDATSMIAYYVAKKNHMEDKGLHEPNKRTKKILWRKARASKSFLNELIILSRL